jgi:pimeloyl-ACP methyl ester carboxylesterase
MTLRPIFLSFLVALYAVRAAAMSEVICAGDCNYDRRTVINEVVTGVNIALDQSGIEGCRGFDLSGDGKVAVNELVAGVGNAFNGCPDARLVRHACDVALPPGQDPNGMDCGYAIVREDRSRTDGRTVRIPFVVLKATGSDPAPDPLVEVSGGPGGPSIFFLPTAVPATLAPFQVQRDIIYFDQRGTGRSLPSLDCPEWQAGFLNYLAIEQSIEQDGQSWVTAMRACHDRLTAEGLNFSAYTSSASAHDMEELLLTLGYEAWNFDAVSYGTRLGQTALRDTPEHIRSIVLDSNVPVQVNQIPSSHGADFERSLQTLFSGCQHDTACNGAFPDLETILFTLVAELNGNPVTLHPVNANTGEPFIAILTGDRLLFGLQQALYDKSLIPLLPLAIASAANGNYALLTAGFGPIASTVTIAWGMYFSVECNEEVPFITAEVIDAANAGVRDEIRDFGLSFWTQLHLDVCAFWGPAAPPALENEPVVSNIPALVLAGEYDPITPPHYSQLVAENLSHSSYFEFPSTSHGVFSGRGCASDMVMQFLADPSVPPDGACIEDITPLQFVVP